MRAHARRPTGFTLIELMVSVTIVGLLASVAIPAFTRLTLRSRTAERAMMLGNIKRAATGLYVAQGQLDLDGGPNPAVLPGTTKRMMDTTQVGWSQITKYAEMEGALYYQYEFHAREASSGALATLVTSATGDLDGDNTTSVRWIKYERRDGLYWTDENDASGTWQSPAPGYEDATTF